ncbi:Putative peptidase S8/S53 domain, PA domain, Fn3-like domain, peptidase S8, subtilisin, His-active [Colletotrichum destructivum]|uniref:Peptidase S8/S53 domain, PA domain, Fn3-like domain, peptidase S8, subtilisin, His-active n=1 Tax=Colletotrichum destructivum TaxID=34406 RepID=A0AAX4I001_9PEZI|nr:Putative peptidase S8/S53 domain, PA domain, Fn3-like domain, peptidase S8, subtilisin, His-active [Colletotrichum destructivum]
MVRSSLLLPLLAAASAIQAKVHSPKTVAGAFIVELEDGQDASDFYAEAEADATTRMKLDYSLFKGASIQFKNLDTADAKAAKLAGLPSVKNIWPVRTYRIPEPEVVWTGKQGRDYVDLKKRQLGNDTFSSHVQTQVDKLHRDGVTGKGIKVAVIDTGIDYLHPALGGCFGPDCLVSYGTDFVGDAYDGFNEHFPDPDPMDCGGHGTHVAGIIAAQSNPFRFLGTAPGVTLGAYKVFGCDGQVSNDILIAAYNRAYEDGSNIITASIGGPSGWTDEPWAATVSRIVEAGVPCTVSAGNSGDQGIFFASTAASGRYVTAIASFDNAITPAVLIENTFTIDGGAPRKFSYTPGEPDNWAGVELPLWTPSTDPTSTVALGCDPYPADTPDLSGKIVLVRRGTCTFVAKAQNAAAAGAKYLMLYNNAPGASSVTVTSVPEILAIGMTSPSQGAVWLEALAAGSEVVLQMTDPAEAEQILTETPNTATGGSVSSFSSWGPNWDAHQKPQFGAIGGNVLSLYPRALGSYAVLSGTSMSCPQAAGIVALIAEVRKTLDPATIENLLSAHANPVKFNYGTGPDELLAPVSQQGAGLVQAYDAAYATTLLSVSSLSFNDTDNFIPELNFTIKNTGSAAVSYDLSNVGAATAYTFAAAGDLFPAPFPNDLSAEYASVALSESKVSVPAGGEATILVTPTPPALDAGRLPVWSGYIALNGSDGSSLSLPYVGIAGSLHSHVTLDQALMTTSTSAKDEEYEPVPSNHTYILPAPGTANETKAVIPALAINMAFGSPFVRADLVPLTTCPPNSTKEVWGIQTVGQPRSFPSLYVSRGVLSVNWDGQMDDGSYAPAGKYKFAIKSLRVFGDASKLEEYDTTETEPFRIVYGAANATAPARH